MQGQKVKRKIQTRFQPKHGERKKFLNGLVRQLPRGSSAVEALLHAGDIHLWHVLSDEIERLVDERFQFDRSCGLGESEQPIEPRGEIDRYNRELRDEVM